MRTNEIFNGISALKLLNDKKNYRKIVHINKNKASLIFYIEEEGGKFIPFYGTGYKNCDPFSFRNLPNFIKRHINVDILQDYVNNQAMGNVKKYPYGLYFEEGESVKI